MTGTITMQELFDSQAEFYKQQAGMLMDFNNIWTEHLKDKEDDDWNDKYYKDLKAMADKHDVEYTEPKFRMGLKGVDISPTIQ